MSDSREFPTRPIASVGALVFKDNRLLLTQRGKPPKMGEWSLPGGAIELGETFAQAAAREIMEECKLRIANIELIDAVDIILRDESDRVQYHYVIVDVTADDAGGELRAASDVMSARWVTRDEVATIKLRVDTRRVIEKAFARKGSAR